jgi:hypothetical protein
LSENLEKHREKLGELLLDIYTQIYSLLESERNFTEALKVVDDQTEMTSKLYGERSY